MADELQEWMRKSTLKMESVPKGRKSRKSTKKMSEFRNLLSRSDFKISKNDQNDIDLSLTFLGFLTITFYL